MLMSKWLCTASSALSRETTSTSSSPPAPPVHDSDEPTAAPAPPVQDSDEPTAAPAPPVHDSDETTAAPAPPVQGSDEPTAVRAGAGDLEETLCWLKSLEQEMTVKIEVLEVMVRDRWNNSIDLYWLNYMLKDLQHFRRVVQETKKWIEPSPKVIRIRCGFCDCQSRQC